MDSQDGAGPTPARPLLRVVRGDAMPEEIAALVALLARRPGGGTPPPRRSAWADPAAMIRPGAPVGAGPGSWARSGREPGVRTRAGW